MSLRTLRKDFERMGLQEDVVTKSLVHMLGEDTELSEEDVDELDEDFEGDDDDDEDEDALDILEGYKRQRKLRGKEKMKSKKYRRSATGKKAAFKQSLKRRKPGQKRIAAKRRKKLGRMGKAKKGFRRQLAASTEHGGEVVTESASLVESMQELAEAIEGNPVELFQGYVDAFNRVADTGELLTLRCHEMDETEMAGEASELSEAAETILGMMEDGIEDRQLGDDDEEMLQEALEVSMNQVAEMMAEYDVLVEAYEPDDDMEELDEDLEDFDDDDDNELDEMRAKGKIRKMTYGKMQAAAAAAKGAGKKEKRRKSTAKKKAVKPSRKKTKSGSEILPDSHEPVMKNLKGRGDVQDKEKLAGWIAHYGSYRK